MAWLPVGGHSPDTLSATEWAPTQGHANFQHWSHASMQALHTKSVTEARKPAQQHTSKS